MTMAIRMKVAAALRASSINYYWWDRYKNSKEIEFKSHALRCKTMSIVQFDRCIDRR